MNKSFQLRTILIVLGFFLVIAALFVRFRLSRINYDANFYYERQHIIEQAEYNLGLIETNSNLTNEQKQLLYKIENDRHLRKDLRDYVLTSLESDNWLSHHITEWDWEHERTVLRRLKLQQEALPIIKKWWTRTERNSLDKTQLMLTIAECLPEKQINTFYLQTFNDSTQTDDVRFCAMIHLFARNNQEAINEILKEYQWYQKIYPKTMYVSLPISSLAHKKQPWDSDGDGLTDYDEQGMLLDLLNEDSDGDGIWDGEDRNPLCRSNSVLTESQKIAHFLFFLYMHPFFHQSPSHFRVIVRTQATREDHSLFAGLELTGANVTVLHFNEQQFKAYQLLHSPWFTPCFAIEEQASGSEDVKRFTIYTSEVSNTYQVKVKLINDTWMPVEWKQGLTFTD